MPRHARLHAPGTLVHVIARFVNKQYRLAGSTERAALLERLPQALSRCDWRLCAYALMSNHVHLALLAGLASPSRFLGPLHTSWARWINRTQGTFGPVFAERATTVYMCPSRTAVLVAYLHNNPVRARLVTSAGDSTWTSHRAWIGREERPSWLAADLGLRAAGFADSLAGREAFDHFVRDRAADPTDPPLSGKSLPQLRKVTRAETRLPVEISSLLIQPQQPTCHVLYPAQFAPVQRWEGDLAKLLALVSARLSVPLAEMCSPSKRPRAVQGRRVVLVTGAWLLRRQQQEVAAVLGLSSTAASQLLRKADSVMAMATELAEQLRAERSSPGNDLGRLGEG